MIESFILHHFRAVSEISESQTWRTCSWVFCKLDIANFSMDVNLPSSQSTPWSRLELLKSRFCPAKGTAHFQCFPWLMISDIYRYLVSSKQFRLKINSACWTLSGPHLHSWSWLVVFQTSIPIIFLLKNQQHIKMKLRWNWNVQGFAKEHWKSTDNLYRSCPLSQNLRVSKFKSAQPTERTECSTTQNPCISPIEKEVKQCQTAKKNQTRWCYQLKSDHRIMGSGMCATPHCCAHGTLAIAVYRCLGSFRHKKSTSLLRMPLCNTGLSRSLTRTANHGNLLQFSNNASKIKFGSEFLNQMHTAYTV